MATPETLDAAPEMANKPFIGMRAPVPTPLQHVYSILNRQRKAIAWCVGIALALGLLLTLLTSKQYTATASVLLEQQAPQVISLPDLDPQRNGQDAERFLQTQVDFLHSRSIAEGVAERLHVTKRPEIGRTLGVDEKNDYSDIVSALQKGITVELGLNTRIASIGFTTKDPNLSAEIANAFAEQLVEANLEGKTGTSERAMQYLQGELKNAKNTLRDSERRLVAAADAGNLVDSTGRTDDERANSVNAIQLGSLSASLAEATARRIAAEQQWLQVKDGPALALPLVNENRSIQDLFSERAKVSADLASEQERYTTDYPSETRAHLKKLDGEISNLAGSIRRSYYASFQTAAGQEQKLSAVVASLRRSILAERARSVEYNAIQREVTTNEALYAGLLQRYKEIAAASGAPSVNITIVDKAFPPLQPSSPSLVRNLALAFILGLIAAMAYVLIGEKRHAVIRSPLDLRNMHQLPLLALVPVAKKDVEAALENPASAQSEAYNSAAVSLLTLMGRDGPKSLLITSAGPNEGKSSTAIGLARSLSRLNKKVLLIDGDLRHPSLGRMLNLMDGSGLKEVLEGTVPANEAIRTAEALGMDAICGGQRCDSPITLLSGERLDRVLEQLGQQYDMILVDGPPVLGLADAVMIANATTSNVIVVEANAAETNQLEVTMSRLPRDKPSSIIMTKFDAAKAGVQYGSEKYYAY